MGMNTLGLRRQRFVNEYLRNGGNATAACEKSGYSNKSRAYLSIQGHRLIRNDKVLAALAPKQAENTGIQARLTASIENFAFSTPTVPVRWKDVLKAMELLIKIHGLDRPDPEPQTDFALFNVKDANPQEIQARLKEIRALQQKLSADTSDADATS